MSGELDPQTKCMIEAMVEEWGEEMKSELAIIHQRRGGRDKGKVRKYSRCNYFESYYDGYAEDSEYGGEDDKLNITYFQGKYDPELYLEWERNMELVFACHNYSEFKKVNLASMLLSDYALTWWDKIVKNRRRNPEEPIMTWKEMKAVMRKYFAPSHYYSENQTNWWQLKATNVSYSRRSFWEKEEQPKVYTRAHVKPRTYCMSFSNPIRDNGGVVTKDERKDSKMEVLEELNEEVEEIEAPPGPLTLFDDGVLSVENLVVDGDKQRENIFHAKDKVSLDSITPLVVEKEIYEDKAQLHKEAEMETSNEQKVETNENTLLYKFVLVGNGDLEMAMEEERSMGANVCKGKVLSTNDLEFSSIYSFVQEFDDVSSKDAFHNLLSIRGSKHLIEFKGIKKLEEFEENEKQNLFPFDVGDEQDLRTNPLQEEGNDAARRS